MAPRTLGLATALALLCLFAADASAHHSASRWGRFYRERYLLCARAPVEHVHCLGPIKARPRLLAALSDAASATGSDLAARVDAAHDAAVDAVYFHVREAIPPLRALLALSLDPADRGQWAEHAKQGLRAEAAYALAHLGDTASAAAIGGLVADLEQRGHGSLWSDTLEALAVIDPARASRYAIDFLGRARDFRTSMPGGSSKLAALDWILAADRDAALPVLERLAKAEERGDDHAHCQLMAARVRLDARVRDDVRRQLAGSYGGTWLAGCANAIIAQLGVDPEDAAALVRHLGRPDAGMDAGVANLAYARILELIAAMDARAASARTGASEQIRQAREVLRRGLDERSAWPHVAAPAHRNYALHYVVYHQAALAGLGDAAARGKLLALVDDPADRTGAAWLAAYWALRLGLPGAAAHAGALAVRGAGYANTERRGSIYQDLRARVLDAFVERFPADPRWTVLLLDPDVSLAAERAHYRLARRAPRGACDAVAAASRRASSEAAEHAFLALGGLGATCRPALERAFDDAGASPEVRGAALELLAVLDAPAICDRIARARRDQVWRPAIERAEILARCAATATPGARPRRGEEPLPPRTHRQGL